MRMTANIGHDARAEVDTLMKQWRLKNADTVRRLVVLGLGGTIAQADALNAEMDARREQAEEFNGRARTPSPREAASVGKQAPIITVRLPGPWARRVTQLGGLKKIVLGALEKLTND